MLPFQIRAGAFKHCLNCNFDESYWYWWWLLEKFRESVLCGRRCKLFPFPYSIHRYSDEHENFYTILHELIRTHTHTHISNIVCLLLNNRLSYFDFVLNMFYMLILFLLLFMFHELRLYIYPSSGCVFQIKFLNFNLKPQFPFSFCCTSEKNCNWIFCNNISNCWLSFDPNSLTLTEYIILNMLTWFDIFNPIRSYYYNPKRNIQHLFNIHSSCWCSTYDTKVTHIHTIWIQNSAHKVQNMCSVTQNDGRY